MRIVVACLCLLFGLASAAFALPVIFDFSTPVTDFSYSAEGLSLQVEAHVDGAETFRITRTRAGLGVSSGINDNAQLENSGPDEFLGFKFSKEVVLQQVVFSLVDKNDEFTLAVDGSSGAGPETIWADNTAPLVDKICAYGFDLNGRLFEFGVNDSKDRIRIKSLTVEAPAAPVPEPASWVLLGMGVVGLVCCRKKFTG